MHEWERRFWSRFYKETWYGVLIVTAGVVGAMLLWIILFATMVWLLGLS